MNRDLILRLDAWLRKTHNRRAPALLLGSWTQSLSFARSLGRRGVPLLVLDGDRFLGGYTRHATFVQLRPPDERPADWLEVLDYVGTRLNHRSALFVMSDALCRLVARHQDQLAGCFNFVVPEHAAVEKIVNKRMQYTQAQQVGIPIPKTFFPESVEEARAVAAEVTYPCLFKPYTSYIGIPRLGAKVWVLQSAEELVDAFVRATTREAHFMIQEIVPGETSAIALYLGFWDREGRERLGHSVNKLREYPSRYGTGCFFITGEVREVLDSGRRLLRAFDYRGFVGVEMKHDARDGAFRLMEINPRVESLIEITVAAGVDVPWLAYEYLQGNDVFAADGLPIPSGVKFVDEQLDVQTFFDLHQRGELSFAQWVRSLRGARPAIAAWDDPGPLLVGVGRALHAKLNTIRKR